MKKINLRGVLQAVGAADTPRFCAAIVPAAGASSRFGDSDKLWAMLCGIPVLARTLKALEETSEVGEIIVAARKDCLDNVAELGKTYGITKLRAVVRGGNTREESVKAGLLAVSPEAALVCVHDAARPLATPDLIGRLIRLADTVNAVIPAIPVRDTVKTVRQGAITSTPKREDLRLAQTPQVFDRHLLEAAILKAEADKKNYTDDASAVEALGVCVRVLEGERENIKLTYPEDMAYAELLLKLREGRDASCASDTATTSTGSSKDAG